MQKINIEDYYEIKVLDESGEWYTNALVKDSFDGVLIVRAYKAKGHSYQVWHHGIDMTEIYRRYECEQ